MKKYTVEYKWSNTTMIELEAENEKEALEQAQELFESGEGDNDASQVDSIKINGKEVDQADIGERELAEKDLKHEVRCAVCDNGTQNCYEHNKIA